MVIAGYSGVATLEAQCFNVITHVWSTPLFCLFKKLNILQFDGLKLKTYLWSLMKPNVVRTMFPRCGRSMDPGNNYKLPHSSTVLCELLLNSIEQSEELSTAWRNRNVQYEHKKFETQTRKEYTRKFLLLCFLISRPFLLCSGIIFTHVLLSGPFHTVHSNMRSG